MQAMSLEQVGTLIDTSPKTRVYVPSSITGRTSHTTRRPELHGSHGVAYSRADRRPRLGLDDQCAWGKVRLRTLQRESLPVRPTTLDS